MQRASLASRVSWANLAKLPFLVAVTPLEIVLLPDFISTTLPLVFLRHTRRTSS